ncbi:MAG: FliM/FliN family flagellar motor switch protein, partial [Myxococcota bacterium]
PVTVVAELRRVNLPLSQLREVKVGQMLDLGPAKDVVLRVGDRATLVGEAGIQNQARSVRVKARIEGEHIR